MIGADGRHSLVAHAVNPPQYHEKPPLLAAYYAYWSGLRCKADSKTTYARTGGWLTPYGPGCALLGAAGYNTDFITAQGIHDAFRDAELCVTALDEAFGGTRSFDAAIADYQSRRDGQVLPMYEFTTELATLEPPPPELQRLLAAMVGNQDAMDGFAQVTAV